MTDYDNYNLHGQVTRDTWDWSNMPAHLRYRDNPRYSTGNAARPTTKEHYQWEKEQQEKFLQQS